MVEVQKTIVDLLAKRCREQARDSYIACSKYYCDEHKEECYGDMAMYLTDHGIGIIKDVK